MPCQQNHHPDHLMVQNEPVLKVEVPNTWYYSSGSTWTLHKSLGSKITIFLFSICTRRPSGSWVRGPVWLGLNVAYKPNQTGPTTPGRRRDTSSLASIDPSPLVGLGGFQVNRTQKLFLINYVRQTYYTSILIIIVNL